MTAEPRPVQETAAKEPGPTAKAVAAWVNQLARTLKTCRLYDSNNPTVIRFREDLADSLDRLLEQHGAITLSFTADDVLFQEVTVHAARSRDDNLALPFHRDGIRNLTLSPGIEPREVEGVLDAVLQVSGQNVGQDDLVTLLWEGGFSHLDVDYVPSAGDIGSGDGQEGQEGEAGIPWPSGGLELGAEEAAAETPQAAGEERASGTRSDDWTTGELTVEIEAGYAELASLAPSETERFRREFAAEHEVSATTTALAIVRAALSTGVTREDRGEFSQFTPRLLRLSVAQGAWLEAHEALDLLRGQDDALFESLVQELLQPISVSTTAEHLDQQDPQAVLAFIELARSLGDSGIDLLNAVLAESQQRRNRRLLAEAIANLCRDIPERLAPYLSDRRWYVVRNIVHILGWIGGNQIVGMLRSALHHPEPRVRYEVVAALGQVEPALARPILLKLLEDADARMFCAVLHQLSAERDPATARLLLRYMQDSVFEQRQPEERRAIYSALSAVASDEVVAELEMELLKGNWFARGQEAHRQAVARVLARIGTPLAKTVLQRGLLSKRGPVKKACEDALAGMAP
jgi:HEAT repeat protein